MFTHSKLSRQNCEPIVPLKLSSYDQTLGQPWNDWGSEWNRHIVRRNERLNRNSGICGINSHRNGTKNLSIIRHNGKILANNKKMYFKFHVFIWKIENNICFAFTRSWRILLAGTKNRKIWKRLRMNPWSVII